MIRLFIKHWKFLLAWLTSLTITWIISFVVVGIAGLVAGFNTSFDEDFNDPIYRSLLIAAQSGALAGGVSGLIVGIVQGLSIRLLNIKRTIGWIRNTVLTSVISWALVFTLDAFVDRNIPITSSQDYTIYLWPILATLGGAAIAGSQWFILRHHILEAEWWIFTNVTIWCMGGMLVTASILDNSSNGPDTFWLFLGFIIIANIVKGGLLVLLKEQNNSGEGYATQNI